MAMIHLARDFSRYPMGRYLSDSPYSAELFRRQCLEPVLADDHIIVVLDGAHGYASSFLEEAFGGLVRHGYITKEALKSKLDIRARDGSLREEILDYIEHADSFVV